MRDTIRAERLLSLFTSPESAAAIAGDLTEEREQRGSFWFWHHAIGTTFAMWRSALTDAPIVVLMLALAACILLIGPVFGGVAAIFLFPSGDTTLNWLALSFFWWGGALWTGASLVGIAPRRGMAACVILAVAGATLLIAFFVTALWHYTLSAKLALLCANGLVGAALLLIGGRMARRRKIALCIPNQGATSMNTRALCAVCALVVAAGPACSQQMEWKDPSPHTTRFVTVDEGVQLEVLDWGGSGPAIVLLAGGGATAHHYDDFAPALTARYRVVGVTRRGHRGSSAAPGGYGFVRLAEDVVRVIDAMGISNPIVIGESFAGEEMHVLGARHSAKIRGLVYIDAAFDRGDDADEVAFNAAARSVPTAPSPQDADLASFTALRAYLEKYGGAGPEAYLRTRYRTNPDGSVGRLWAPDRPIFQAMTNELKAAYNPYNPERIRVPALAIYALPKSADDLMRRGSSDRSPFPELVAMTAADRAMRESVEKLFRLTRERVRKHIKWFEAFAERARVVELSGNHDLIVSNPREVLEQIEAFVSSLPGKS